MIGLSKKVKAISAKGLTKDLINNLVFSMEQNIFHQEYFRIIQYLWQLKKYIKYFSGTNQINLWKSNGISEENIENITKSESNFVPTFVNHHVLPDINFNGHCLIKNNYICP